MYRLTTAVLLARSKGDELVEILAISTNGSYKGESLYVAVSRCMGERANEVVLAFLFGVLSLTFSCLLYGMAPEWFPFAYTAQSAFYLPTRIWTYKRKAYHYFLFGELLVSRV